MKKWKILEKAKNKKQKTNWEDVIKVLLKNRNLNTKKEIESFLNPDINDATLTQVDLDISEFKKFKKSRCEKSSLCLRFDSRHTQGYKRRI